MPFLQIFNRGQVTVIQPKLASEISCVAPDTVLGTARRACERCEIASRPQPNGAAEWVNVALTLGTDPEARSTSQTRGYFLLSYSSKTSFFTPLHWLSQDVTQ